MGLFSPLLLVAVAPFFTPNGVLVLGISRLAPPGIEELQRFVADDCQPAPQHVEGVKQQANQSPQTTKEQHRRRRFSELTPDEWFRELDRIEKTIKECEKRQREWEQKLRQHRPSLLAGAIILGPVE